MKPCLICGHVEGTHRAGCPRKSTPLDAVEVLDVIGTLLPDAELDGYEDGRERWLAIQNHVAELVRCNTRLDKRNVELERRLLDVVAAAKGIRTEKEESDVDDPG
jgi:hypothetical protein